MRSVTAAVLASVLLGTPAPRLAADETCVALEDFSTSTVGQFPAGWKVREDAGRGVYTVQAEGRPRFLRAMSRGLGIQAARQLDWNLGQRPVLRWKWRPRVFPRGADERTGRNDSALSVYAVFPHTPVTVKTLKYIWSEQVPEGIELELTQGLTKALVVESGPPREPGAWVEEQANIARDYLRRFGEREVGKPAGIAVLTDADDTKSSAEGDYADFRACRE